MTIGGMVDTILALALGENPPDAPASAPSEADAYAGMSAAAATVGRMPIHARSTAEAHAIGKAYRSVLAHALRGAVAMQLRAAELQEKSNS